MGATGMAELAARGANITDGMLFLRYVNNAVDHFHHQRKLEFAFEQYGWKADNSAFLYGAKLYTAGSVTDANVSTELGIRNQWTVPAATSKVTLRRTALSGGNKRQLSLRSRLRGAIDSAAGRRSPRRSCASRPNT